MSDRMLHDSPLATANLRILATSDVHMQLSGWDARTDLTQDVSGMDRLATVIRQARADASGAVLLVDNGDAVQGTAMADVLADQGTATQHPWPRILEALDYDVVGLGNHDFDYGLPYLTELYADIKLPLLGTNVHGDALSRIAPHCIITKHPLCSDGQNRLLRIGIVSVLPMQTMIWNKRQLEGRVCIPNGVLAARDAVTALHDEGADLIVMLCHGGLDADADATSENFALPLARDVAGIDAMIMGHTHRQFPGPDHAPGPAVDNAKGTVAGVPAVMPGFAAQMLGQIDLMLGWNKKGWQVEGHSVRLRPVDRAARDAQVSAMVAPAEQATRTRLAQPIGQSTHGFNSYFAMLQSGTSDALVARALMDAAQARVAGTDLADYPLIAAVAPLAAGGIGGVGNYVDVSAGTITERHIAMICPYRNAISAVLLRGADLWAWAAHAAAFFGHASTGDAPLVAAGGAAFNFDGLHGLETVYDLDAVPGKARVAALMHKGRAVDRNDQFLVAMTSYRAAGGGKFPGLDTAQARVQIDTDVTHVLRALIRSDGVTGSPAPSVWRFRTGTGHSRVIETSPRAERHLDDIAAFSPEPLGLTDGGFLKLRITL
ncbi:MAG: 5'-nucleotidase C-terminal domain-containing protein [Pseudomonadota bacterium]